MRSEATRWHARMGVSCVAGAQRTSESTGSGGTRHEKQDQRGSLVQGFHPTGVVVEGPPAEKLGGGCGGCG